MFLFNRYFYFNKINPYKWNTNLHLKQLKKETIATAVMNKKIKNVPSENAYDFTEYVEKQKEENEIDLGLFFELVEKK